MKVLLVTEHERNKKVEDGNAIGFSTNVIIYFFTWGLPRGSTYNGVHYFWGFERQPG